MLAGVSLLGKFISVREPNIKYLGLENMVRLAEVPAVADTVNRCAVETAALPLCAAIEASSSQLLPAAILDLDT